ILFEVEVPFVPKNSSLHPNALAAFSWATLMFARRFEQRIQTTGRGGRFSQKDVGSIKVAEVSNPVGVEDGLASGNRKSVECADRTARVVFEVIEIRCVVALVHAFEESEMDFHQVFEYVLNAPDVFGIDVACHFFR